MYLFKDGCTNIYLPSNMLFLSINMLEVMLSGLQGFHLDLSLQTPLWNPVAML